MSILGITKSLTKEYSTDLMYNRNLKTVSKKILLDMCILLSASADDRKYNLYYNFVLFY